MCPGVMCHLTSDLLFSKQSPYSLQGLESLEKPWIWLNQIQGLEILEFYKVVLKSLKFNFGK